MGAVQVRVNARGRSPVCVCISSIGRRRKQTFGRWVGKAFVAGILPFSGVSFKQPLLDLYSWKVYKENGKDIRVSF